MAVNAAHVVENRKRDTLILDEVFKIMYALIGYSQYYKVLVLKLLPDTQFHIRKLRSADRSPGDEEGDDHHLSKEVT